VNEDKEFEATGWPGEVEKQKEGVVKRTWERDKDE